MYRFWLSIVLSVLLLSCSSEKSAEVGSQSPEDAEKGSISETSGTDVSAISGSYALEIKPRDASRNSTIYLVPTGFNLSDGKIEWLLNGRVVTSPVPSRYNPTEANKGDSIQVKAIIKGTEILSNTIQIKNASPELSKVKIMPEIFKPDDTLYIEASGNDADGDAVTILYEWTKNGEPAGKSNKIEGPVKRGDKISIKITPFDGETYGRTIFLDREIRNMPPMIIEKKDFNIYGRVYTYQIKATDPDGDTLTYSLKASPEGMTVDSTTGLIKWNIPPNFKGKTSLTFSVSDGHGGEATQSFTVDIPS